MNVYHCVKLMKLSKVLGGDMDHDALKFEAFSDHLGQGKILCGTFDLNAFEHVNNELLDSVLEEAATSVLSEFIDGLYRLIKTELDIAKAEYTGDVQIRRELS